MSKTYQTSEYKVLPYIVFRNPAHIIALCEAGGIEEYWQVAINNGCFGLVCESNFGAPALACFLRGSPAQGAVVELIMHLDHQSENVANVMWLFHGCIFRCIFGNASEGTMLDRQSGTRMSRADIPAAASSSQPIEPHSGPISSSNDFSVGVIHMVPDAEMTVSSTDIPVYRYGDETVVHRTGLSEARVAVFHINSYSFRLQFSQSVYAWTQFVAAAIASQCDYITGAGNLFAQRAFKAELCNDFHTCILTDILERTLEASNRERTYAQRITYQVVSSTQHKEWVKSQMRLDNDSDCMIAFSICYGKQVAIQQERARIYEQRVNDGITSEAPLVRDT